MNTLLHLLLMSLKKSTPKLPAQTVANDLALQQIPDELANLNDLEWRFINLKIPFMKVLPLRKGGQSKKMNHVSMYQQNFILFVSYSHCCLMRLI